MVPTNTIHSALCNWNSKHDELSFQSHFQGAQLWRAADSWDSKAHLQLHQQGVVPANHQTGQHRLKEISTFLWLVKGIYKAWRHQEHTIAPASEVRTTIGREDVQVIPRTRSTNDIYILTIQTSSTWHCSALNCDISSNSEVPVSSTSNRIHAYHKGGNVTELYPNSMNTENGFCLKTSWKPPI